MPDTSAPPPYRFVPLADAQLTVVTLTYNASTYIARSLASLLTACDAASSGTMAQRPIAHLPIAHLPIAHLVVDGESEDDTLAQIQRLSPTTTIRSHPPRGIYDALNYAIDQVATPYVMYLHSDDELDPGFFSAMLTRLQRLDDAQMHLLYGTVDFIDAASHLLFSRRPPVYFDAVQAAVPVIFHPNAIYPTVLEKGYPYSTALGLAADQAHLRTIAPRAILHRVPEARYRFRMSAASSTMSKHAGAAPSVRSFSWPRLYIRLFETHWLRRLAMKVLHGRTYWTNG